MGRVLIICFNSMIMLSFFSSLCGCQLVGSSRRGGTYFGSSRDYFQINDYADEIGGAYLRIGDREAEGVSDDPKLIELMIFGLSDNRLESGDRSWIARLLGKSGSNAAVAPLAAYLRDGPDWGVEQAAAHSLALLAPDAVEPLVALVKDISLDINRRSLALGALGEMNHSAANDALYAIYTDNIHTDNFDYSRAALAYLGSKKDARALEPLIEHSKDCSVDSYRQCAEKIGQYGRPAILPLIRALKGEDLSSKFVAALAFEHVGGDAAGMLGEELDGRNHDYANWAALALWSINTPLAIGRLDSAVSGKDLASIARDYASIIRAGKPGSELELIVALQRLGERDMALAYLNCGNTTLKYAGMIWAQKQGFHTFAIFNAPPRTGPVWGR